LCRTSWFEDRSHASSAACSEKLQIPPKLQLRMTPLDADDGK